MYLEFFGPFFKEKKAFIGPLATGLYRGAGVANKVNKAQKNYQHGVEAKQMYQQIKKVPQG